MKSAGPSQVDHKCNHCNHHCNLCINTFLTNHGPVPWLYKTENPLCVMQQASGKSSSQNEIAKMWVRGPYVPLFSQF